MAVERYVPGSGYNGIFSEERENPKSTYLDCVGFMKNGVHVQQR
jgi:hypothetical protein